MEHTARFIVFALRLTGVPVYREGLSIATPTRELVRRRSMRGLALLVACFTGGVLFAYLRYRSLGRALRHRGGAVVPVVANWLRAYLIVMLGEISGGRLRSTSTICSTAGSSSASSPCCCSASRRWREDDPTARRRVDPRFPGGRVAHTERVRGRRHCGGRGDAVWPAVASHLDGDPADAPPALAVPDAGDWQMAGHGR